MFIQFLGTGAGSPSVYRNVSSIALIFKYIYNNVWLFDCGEATQHQILKTNIKFSKINKIFITHLHGDHIFGLPGLLTTKSLNSSKDILEIYGNKNLKKYINMSINLSKSYISFPIKFIEIKEGIIFDDKKIKISCFPLNHTLECFGFRIDEYKKNGKLNCNKLIKDGINPGPVYKYLKQGKSILFNGRIINGFDYLGPSKKGKSIVILGDTAPLENICSYLMNVDILIHESTLDFYLSKKANSRGHSTNIQAAKIAKKYNVKKLIITHFSARYNKYDIKNFLLQCKKLFFNVKVASDFDIYEI